MDKEFFKDIAEEIASGAAGIMTGIGSISIAGGSLSASGISGGLATIGGSMLGGIIAVPVIGYAAYKGTKHCLRKYRSDLKSE